MRQSIQHVAMALMLSAPAFAAPTTAATATQGVVTMNPYFMAQTKSVAVLVEEYSGQIKNQVAGKTIVAAPTASADPKSDIAQSKNYLTVNVHNAASNPVTLDYGANAGGPRAISNSGPSLNGGATGTNVYPVGFSGRIGVGHVHDQNDESLIEFTYDTNGQITYINVSYVDGFSAPITCSCNGRPITGCNKPLFSLHKCADEINGPICVNPERGTPNGPASPFFAPCAHLATTYPDDTAGSVSACSAKTITCCVGPNCPAYNGGN